MDINGIRPPVTPQAQQPTPVTPVNTGASAKTTTDKNQPSELKQVIAKESGQAAQDSAQKAQEAVEQLTKENVVQVTENLNKIMKAIDTDLRFQIHEGMNRLMVQVISRQDQQVIKEIPSHELLDTLAAIRDYVGVLLDKKA